MSSVQNVRRIRTRRSAVTASPAARCQSNAARTLSSSVSSVPYAASWRGPRTSSARPSTRRVKCSACRVQTATSSPLLARRSCAYRRSDSSIRYRVVVATPSAPTIDFRTRPARPSSTVGSSSPLPVATDRAVVIVQPPAKTERRENRVCSFFSRSWCDQSMAPRSVWWRPACLRSTPKSWKRCSRWWTISAGVIESIRTAASSSASGMPSRRRQSSATSAWFSAVSPKLAVTAHARSTNSFTAADPASRSASVSSPGAGTSSTGTRKTCS